jgi:hypothetical protein
MSGNVTSWNYGQIRDALAMTSGVVTQRPGAAFMLTVSVSGTVTLTLLSGATVVITPGVGDTIVPFQVTQFVTGTATVTAAYNLYL